MNLPPVTHPGHNLWEICKQLVLLEAHLQKLSKRCPDCIQKHFIGSIAYAEEMPTLSDDTDLFEIAADIQKRCKGCFAAWMHGGDPLVLAQELRNLRKGIQPLAVDIWDDESGSEPEMEAPAPQMDCVPGRGPLNSTGGCGCDDGLCSASSGGCHGGCDHPSGGCTCSGSRR